MKSRHHISLFCSAVLSLGVPGAFGEPINATSTMKDPQMEEHFRVPPDNAMPWVYWMWLRVDTTFEAITADLEAMRASGIRGFILYDSGGVKLSRKENEMVLVEKGYQSVPTTKFSGGYDTPMPTPALAAWGPRSLELFRFVAKESHRLGLKFCLSIGLAGTSGPIPSEYGQQKLVWSETTVEGPANVDTLLPPPGKAKVSNFITVLALPDRPDIAPSEIIKLAPKCAPDGRLRWKAPAGRWKILRFAHLPTGAKNVWGYYSDTMRKEALEKTWEVTVGKLLKEMSPEERKGLYAIEDDSWESGEVSWTKHFPTEFHKLRGYDLIPWLPVLAGKRVGSLAQTEGVRRDFDRTVADLIADNHYGHLRTLAHRNNLISYSEAAGPNTSQLDPIKNIGAVDFGMGEFWVPSPHRPTLDRRFLLRTAATANHIYGKAVTPCEAFTSVGPHWEDSFFFMKNTADQAFADGCNQMIIHCFSHSPSVTAMPGYVYFAGTHYTRQNTWWNQTPAFNGYLGRISHLLQQGLFVADALYYRDDDRRRYIPTVGLGPQRKMRAALPAHGYDYDNCNLDALLWRVSVKAGRLMLPDGMSYRLLVLPDDSPIALPALEKIAELVDAGAVVVGPPPRGLAGLAFEPGIQTKFNALLARLWGEKRIADHQPSDALKSLGVPPDFEFSGLSRHGEIDWIHRSVGDTEIYFISSLWDNKEKLDATFRVCGKQPELWNPVTGEIRDAREFRQESGRTILPLRFEPRESVLVVFRKPIAAIASGPHSSNYPVFSSRTEVAGPWQVSFDPAWGGPAKISFDTLTDWSENPDEGIKYYSGTAAYRKLLHLPALTPPEETLWLDLGEVREVASVKLNGTDLGVVWTKPARVDITKAARTGDNYLEITVVNLWPNRLIGDERLPKEQRRTETNIHKFTPATPLYPSGLLGPVTLQTARLLE